MKTFNKLFAALMFCLAFVVTGPKSHAQQVDPSYQIAWPSGCTATGAPYVPGTNTCVPFSGVVTNPTGSQSVVQPSTSLPLTVNYASFGIVNGIPQADLFCGNGTVGGVTQPACSADMCVKLRAANLYAVQNGVRQVDATHFYGTQACSVDPITSVATAGTTAHLTDNFGAVHIQSAVQWTINNSGVTLHGLDPQMTQLEYTGASVAQAVLKTYSGSSTVLYNVNISGMFFYGDVSNATYGFLSEDTAHSRFDNVYAWGIVTCGIETWGDVTDTFINDRTSQEDAAILGIANSSHTVPTNGICLDIDPNSPSFQTTNSTFIDVAAEYVTGAGWLIANAQTVTFSSGTSEGNGTGIYVSGSNSKFNTFIGSDIEANTANTTGVDVNDVGSLNVYINLIATSVCTGSCTNSVLLTGSGIQQLITGGFLRTGASGLGYNDFNQGAVATTATTGADGAPPAQVGGYLVFTVKGVNVKIPYYNN